ncbi:hypothetical protein SH580_03195 [Coraliomargarita algicola]|uniref:Glycoside hydrolase family 42 N-terminal domain-containing protein n=1 Tax=Coraliomargarita algicola TaxID=3092156 RepID=A0ABZ0RUT0_9BACT|nr:hypothetical protein [Coraliomargarita sp. J2-16]WPJ96709.1 hypothetical protein SH580_03195 [Coraliomargarita sp. J2-16]
MSFPFTCLEVNSLTPENVERVCRYAKRFNVRSIAYMGAEWQRYQFVDHTEWGVPPVDEAARAFMEEYQGTIRAASEQVSSHGLDFYLWRRELRLPLGFVEKYGVDWVNFENSELWELLRWNTRELFKLFPQTKGIFLSCTGEQKPGEWITANGVGGHLPLWQRFEKMFLTVREVCDELDREVVFRNHGVGEEGIPLVYDENTYMWHYLKAARALGADTTLMAKAVEPDYQASYPFNGVLGPMAQQQPTYIEFSLPMEYNAVGRTPFPMVEDIKMRILKAREIGCQGAVARIDWHMSQHRTIDTWSCLDNFTEINVYAFCRLINEPGLPVASIFQDFCKERFGSAAMEAAVEIYKDLYEAGCKTYYEQGTLACRTPSGAPLNPQSHLIALRKDHVVRWSFSPMDYANQDRALHPDARWIERIIAEKNEAVALYRQALQVLDSNQENFKEADYIAFRSGLQRAIDECDLRREYMAAFFAWLAFYQKGQESFKNAAKAYLKIAQPMAATYAAEYDGLEAPDPDARNVFQFGVNIQNSIECLQQELQDTEAYWSSSVSAPLQPDGATEGAFIIAVGALRLVVDPQAFMLRAVFTKEGRNLLTAPQTLATFRVGGLEEAGKHVGRTFVNSRAKSSSEKVIETSFRFGCQGANVCFIADQAQATLQVRCRMNTLPAGAQVELPWLSDILLSQPELVQDCQPPRSSQQAQRAVWEGPDLSEISVCLSL